MHNYDIGDLISDTVSDIYILSISAALLAVIITLYYAHFFRESKKNFADKSMGTKKNMNSDRAEDAEEYDVDDDLTDLGSEPSNSHLSCEDSDEEEQMHFQRQTRVKRISRTKPEAQFISNCPDSDEDSETDINNDGLVAKLKTRRLKELEAKLTRDQLNEERRIEREQLSAIFELLKKQEAELNTKEIDENELNAQLSLYR